MRFASLVVWAPALLSFRSIVRVRCRHRTGDVDKKLDLLPTEMAIGSGVRHELVAPSGWRLSTRAFDVFRDALLALFVYFSLSMSRLLLDVEFVRCTSEEIAVAQGWYSCSSGATSLVRFPLLPVSLQIMICLRSDPLF